MKGLCLDVELVGHNTDARPDDANEDTDILQLPAEGEEPSEEAFEALDALADGLAQLNNEEEDVNETINDIEGEE